MAVLCVQTTSSSSGSAGTLHSKTGDAARSSGTAHTGGGVWEFLVPLTPEAGRWQPRRSLRQRQCYVDPESVSCFALPLFPPPSLVWLSCDGRGDVSGAQTTASHQNTWPSASCGPAPAPPPVVPALHDAAVSRDPRRLAANLTLSLVFGGPLSVSLLASPEVSSFSDPVLSRVDLPS